MDERIIAVQRMQDYIETYFEESISLTDLAKASLYSPWYSYRIFKVYTNLTPFDYIRKLRLSISALKLRDDKMKIIDVALKSGFDSVDGYRRAFYKEFGCNPNVYANKNTPIPLFTPYGVKFKKIEKRYSMDNLKNVYIQVIEKEPRKVIIKRGIKASEYMSYCAEVGCDVWGLLKSIKSLNGEPVCLWLPKKYVKANTSTYVQGVEVPISYDGQIPDGFDIIYLPKAKYLMFQGEPFNEEDYCEAIECVEEAKNRYNPNTIGYEWDNSNPTIQLEPIGKRGYIELYGIKSI